MDGSGYPTALTPKHAACWQNRPFRATNCLQKMLRRMWRLGITSILPLFTVSEKSLMGICPLFVLFRYLSVIFGFFSLYFSFLPAFACYCPVIY